MADPRELLLGTPEEQADYRRWEAGRNANTLNPNGVVQDAKNAAQYLWDNKANILMSAIAPPSAHIAAAFEEPASLPSVEERMPEGAEPPVRYTPGAEPPVWQSLANPPAEAQSKAVRLVNPEDDAAVRRSISEQLGQSLAARQKALDEQVALGRAQFGDPTPEEMQSRLARETVDNLEFGPAGGDLEAVATSLNFDLRQQSAKNKLAYDAGQMSLEEYANAQVALEEQYAALLEEAKLKHGKPSIVSPVSDVPDLPAPKPVPLAEVAQAPRVAEAAAAAPKAAEAAAVATRAGRLGRLAEALAAKAGPVADAAVVGTLPFAAAAALGLKAVDMTPEAELRHISFGEGQGPLDMGMIGRHVSALRANPDLAKKLWMDGVISTPAYVQITDGAGAPNYEPMVNAMRRLNAVQ